MLHQYLIDWNRENMLFRIKRCGAPGMLATAFLLLACASTNAQQVSLEKLVADAKSSDETVQRNAIHQMGTLGAAAVPALTDLLKSDSPVVRGYAARALAMIGPAAKGATEGVIDLLGDPEPAVRRYAIEALAAIRPGPQVSVPLFIKLMQDSDPGVQMRVMSAVADAKGKAVPALIEALNNEGAAFWACIILRDIGPDASDAVPALTEKLKDSNPQIRREAILALAAIGSPDAVPAIAPLLKDEQAAVAATYALAMLGSIPPEADAVVRANVKSKDPMLSATSMWALGRLHPDDKRLTQAVIEHLVPLLKNEDAFVRTAAARALASLPPNPEIAGPIFKKAMDEGDETTTAYMLDALAGLGEPAVPQLIKALKYPSLQAQVSAILGRIGPPAAPATAALAELLSNPDQNVSVEAAHALSAIGPGAKAAVPELIKCLENTEGKPAHAAVYALGMIGPEAKPADTALVAILKDSDNSLSVLSAWSLFKIHGANQRSAEILLPELITGLSSPMPQSRLLAAETLGDFGPFAKSAAEPLERLANDSNEQVKAAATKALASIKK